MILVPPTGDWKLWRAPTEALALKVPHRPQFIARLLSRASYSVPRNEPTKPSMETPSTSADLRDGLIVYHSGDALVSLARGSTRSAPSMRFRLMQPVWQGQLVHLPM